MKSKIYNWLVNRQSGIKQRYHQFHDDSHGIKKMLSWCYLLWLNFAFYVLKMRSIGKAAEIVIYEEKKLEYRKSESVIAQTALGSVDEFVEELLKYDTISFDIFDTLIFRPFSEPTDLFFFVGERLGVMNFKELRIRAEKEAREKGYAKKGHYEVTLGEIWEQLEELVGHSVADGKKIEAELELKFCYSNPFMKEVYQKLLAKGKHIIVVSDMYLPSAVLSEILRNSGYKGYEKLYVSCEFEKSKATGDLYEVVKRENMSRIIHIGDNEHSDVDMAKRAGIATKYYPNVNKNSLKYRPQDMSVIVGGAYRGIVNNWLHSGMRAETMEYEYGFVYGGLFVTGYCSYIHEYCRKNQIDKVLFLSRDGDILRQAYHVIFPEESTEYVYWSRRAATKLMAEEDKYDYYRRFLFHKVNQGITLKKIFLTMELECLLPEWNKVFSEQEELTDRNVTKVRKFLDKHWSEVVKAYAQEQEAARNYYKKVLDNSKRVVAVDIGWAGSGAVALNHLVQKVWKIPCEVIGIIAGTNTIHNAEPDASETFLQSGQLVSYLYSQCHNRDLMKKHDSNRNYNIYWELLLASPTPQFKGFSLNQSGEVSFCFGAYDTNQAGIKEIQKGILDFVTNYKKHFGDMTYMLNISGRDAYAPMLLATSKEERYLKEIEKRFSLEVNVS